MCLRFLITVLTRIYVLSLKAIWTNANQKSTASTSDFARTLKYMTIVYFDFVIFLRGCSERLVGNLFCRFGAVSHHSDEQYGA